MNPFPANDELITWFATSRTSRKAREIRSNPKVCVYYADHISAKGYVNITGKAEVIDDKDLLVKMKRAYWEGIPDWQVTTHTEAHRIGDGDLLRSRLASKGGKCMRT